MMPFCDCSDRTVLEKPALFDGRVSHEWDLALTTPWQQVMLDTAAREVVQHLIRLASRAFRNRHQFFHIRNVEVADAPVPDPAGSNKLFKTIHRLFQRNGFTPVEKININVIGFEAPQASFAGFDRAACCRITGQHLADEYHFLAASADRFTDELLRGAVAIHFSGVDQRHPKVYTSLQGKNFLASRTFPLAKFPRSLS